MVFENNPELDGKFLGTISSDFVKVCDTLKEASHQLRIRGISNFPIFAISTRPIDIGLLLLAKEDIGTKWNYYFTYLENLIDTQLVEADKEELFKTTWKDPDEFICFLVAENGFLNFVYMPYPED